ncbi:hypothetical protein FNF28_06036 [Cafeteria roenbergensis]|uniref:Uncharacterized protein n=1 Tax=Cafeteria roenbergensis TaxID=33653 RepID=A0A5A8D2Y3_CAFRO|nr:hypothetical protein FNF28_06036 [Cafeteria roenbergensis]
MAAKAKAKEFVAMMTSAVAPPAKGSGLSQDAERQMSIDDKRRAIIKRRNAMGKELRLERKAASELVTSIAASDAIRGAQKDPHSAVAKRDYTVDFATNNPANLVGRYHAFKIQSSFPIPGAAVFDDLRRRKLVAAAAATEDRVALERARREEEAAVRAAVRDRRMAAALETPFERAADALGRAIEETSKALQASGQADPGTAVANREQMAILEDVRRKRVVRVEEAFERGDVTVNAVEPSMHNSGLMLAVQAGLLSLTRLYLRYGGDPNRSNRPGQVPIHVAWSSWLKEPVESPKRQLQLLVVTDILAALLEYGANPNTRNHNGLTAMHFAASYGHEAILRLLLRAGGAAHSRDRHGRAPIDLARRRIEALEAKAATAAEDDAAGGGAAAAGPPGARLRDGAEGHRACVGLLANWEHIQKARRFRDFRAAWSHAMAQNATEFRAADEETRSLRQAQLIRTGGAAGTSDASSALRAGDSSPMTAAGRRATERLWGTETPAASLIQRMELQEEMRLRNRISSVEVKPHLMALPAIETGAQAQAREALTLHGGAADVDSDGLLDDDDDDDDEDDGDDDSDSSLALLQGEGRADGLIDDSGAVAELRMAQRKQHAARKWAAAQRDMGAEVEAHIRKDLMRRALGVSEDKLHAGAKASHAKAASGAAAQGGSKAGGERARAGGAAAGAGSAGGASAAAGAPAAGGGSDGHSAEEDPSVPASVAAGLRAVKEMKRRRRQAAVEAVTDADGIEARGARLKLVTGETYIRRPALRSTLLRGARLRVDHVQRTGPAPLSGVYTGSRRGQASLPRHQATAAKALWDGKTGPAPAGGFALEDVDDSESVRAIHDNDSVAGGLRGGLGLSRGRGAGSGAFGQGQEEEEEEEEEGLGGLAVGVAEAEVRVMRGRTRAALERHLLPSSGSAADQERRTAIEARQAERREAERRRAAAAQELMLARDKREAAAAAEAAYTSRTAGTGSARGTARSGTGRMGTARAAHDAGKAIVARMMEPLPKPAPSGGARGRGGAASRRSSGGGGADDEDEDRPNFGPLHMGGGLPASQSLMALSRFDLLDDVPGRGITRAPLKAATAADEVRRKRERLASQRPHRSDSNAYDVLDDRRDAARLTRFGRFPVPEEPHRYAELDAAHPVPTFEM